MTVLNKKMVEVAKGEDPFDVKYVRSLQPKIDQLLQKAIAQLQYIYKLKRVYFALGDVTLLSMVDFFNEECVLIPMQQFLNVWQSSSQDFGVTSLPANYIVGLTQDEENSLFHCIQ